MKMKHSVRNIKKLVSFLDFCFNVQILQNLPPDCFIHYFIKSEIIRTLLRTPVGLWVTAAYQQQKLFPYLSFP